MRSVIVVVHEDPVNTFRRKSLSSGSGLICTERPLSSPPPPPVPLFLDWTAGGVGAGARAGTAAAAGGSDRAGAGARGGGGTEAYTLLAILG
mmetsp:Transcript_7539/g.16057  ORF Transcript_7539/g.16057 Transcript_7539/m.16057 type:complete len:92 (+) Transcript_7539:123-398(+)